MAKKQEPNYLRVLVNGIAAGAAFAVLVFVIAASYFIFLASKGGGQFQAFFPFLSFLLLLGVISVVIVGWFFSKKHGKFEGVLTAAVFLAASLFLAPTAGMLAMMVALSLLPPPSLAL